MIDTKELEKLPSKDDKLEKGKAHIIVELIEYEHDRQTLLTMKNVTLKFPSTHILWLFRRTISLVSLQVNPALRTLTCACNAEDVNVAISSYGAEIVEIKRPGFVSASEV